MSLHRQALRTALDFLITQDPGLSPRSARVDCWGLGRVRYKAGQVVPIAYGHVKLVHAENAYRHIRCTTNLTMMVVVWDGTEPTVASVPFPDYLYHRNNRGRQVLTRPPKGD